MAKKLYTMEAVDLAVEELQRKGYEIVNLGGCLLDSYFCIAPDEQHYHFYFAEEYLNEWSSAYSVRRYSKIPKWAKDEMYQIYLEETEVYA